MNARAVGLRECARRIDISYRTAQRLVAEGTFPVPELTRVGRKHRYSERDIERYLDENATADARKAS